MQQNPVIETINLSIGYSHQGKVRRVVHESLNLALQAGELTSLLGLNGAGKSTLLRTICGFQPSLGGEVRINGRAVSGYSQSELSRLIGVVLTEKTNAGGISVEELVGLGRHPYTGFFGRLHEEDRRIVSEALEAVGMSRHAASHVSELSDGERQKVMIAKVLAQQCPIIILDEPTAYLDITSRIETMSLLHHLAVGQQKAVLLSTHDLDLALQMSDCIWLQEKGRPMACGAPEDLVLDGSFSTFFDRKGITFEQATGKLKAEKSLKPVCVEGDGNISHWVGNALIRNGYQPVENMDTDLKIRCIGQGEIVLSIAGENIVVGSIGNLVGLLRREKEFSI